jgi:hypothetical protein
VNAILDAGLEADESKVTILLFDTDGNLWKKQPDQMNADDAIEYIGHFFGLTFWRGDRLVLSGLVQWFA